MQQSLALRRRAGTNLTRSITAIGLAALIAGCADSTLAPNMAPSASVVPADSLTHPAGVISGTTPLDGEPYGVDVSITGTIYATQLDFGTLAVSNIATQTITGSVTVGQTPTSVVFSPDGLTAYVANEGGTVSVVDVASGTQTAAIPMPDGSSPFAVAVSANGRQVFVGTNGSAVFVMNARTFAIADQIPVGGASNGFALSPDNKTMFVSSFVAGTVTEFVVKTHAIVQTFSPGGAPQGLVTNRHGTELYVVNENGFVSLFDIASGALIATLPLTAGGFGAAVTPDDNHLYLTEPSAGLVQIVNLKTRQLKGTINVGGNPRRVAFSATGRQGVITNLNGYLTFIN